MKQLLISLLAPAVLMASGANVNIGDISISGVTEQTRAPQISFTGSYPRFAGMQDTARQKQLNISMQELERAALERAKAARISLPTGDGPERVVEGVFGYEVKRNGGGLVSLLFSDYLYSGGANGQIAKKGITFSSMTGQSYTLADLFRNNASYADSINREIEKQLKERGLEDKLLRNFTGITDAQTFYVTDSELVIVVQETDWFPHYMGAVEFPIPFSQLRSYLKESVINE